MKKLKTLVLIVVVLMATVIGNAEPIAAIGSVQQLPSEIIDGVLGPLPGIYSETQVLLPTSLASGPIIEYRFEGQASWFVFDRPLYLTAFAGEERAYTIDFRSTGSSLISTLTYTLDMRSPEPPRFGTPSGEIESSLDLVVHGSDEVYVSIDGKPFEKYDNKKINTFVSPADSTLGVRAVAYAVDPLGNASRTSAAIWRLSPPGIMPSFPLNISDDFISISKLDTLSDLTADLADLVGSVRLDIQGPEGSIPCAAVNAVQPYDMISAYAELSGSQAAASCIIPFPWGYEKEITVHYGYSIGGVFHIHPEPLRVRPRFPAEDAIAAPLTPVSPKVRMEASTAFIDWPANPWTIFVSFDDVDYIPYNAPLTVQMGKEPITFRYFSLGQNGARSPTVIYEIPAYEASPDPLVTGVENGSVYGNAVSVSSIHESVIRYEVSEGDAIPPAVTLGSPVLNSANLWFEGRAGEVVRYRMRLVTGIPGTTEKLQGTSLPSERFISFTIDRKPPDVPRLAQSAKTYSSSDSLISFVPISGTIFLSISEDGSGPFVRYAGPTTISGSDEGRKRYTIKAYAEDEFGNRSAEMEPQRLLIDRSSLYADPAGRPGASGSPDDPIAYLDEAVKVALDSGKRFIYIRGSMVLRKPVQINGKLTIAGGFDADWNESPSSTASITTNFLSGSGLFAFTVHGGYLTLSSLSISMAGDSSGGIIDAKGGSLSIVRTYLKATGGIEMVAIRSVDSVVELNSSSMDFNSMVTGRGLDLHGGKLLVEDVSVSCSESVRMFDALRITDSSARIIGLRLDGAPAQAMSGLSASRSDILVERSVFSIQGGASSCRLFGASASSLVVSSTYLDAEWAGSCEIFSASNGSKVSVAHISAIITSPRSVFFTASGSSYLIKNSIATFYSNSSVFIRSDKSAEFSSISANCLWGFSKLFEGPLQVTSLTELNRYALAGRTNITEDPSRIFSAEIKGLRRLARTSACVDAGASIEWGSSLDLLGSPRVSRQGKAMPDIGAEEL